MGALCSGACKPASGGIRAVGADCRLAAMLRRNVDIIAREDRLAQTRKPRKKSSMPNLEDYQCEHLFLLVGKNPLPNYVAARLLAKSRASGEKPTLYLVCSTDTLEYADRLADKLGNANFSFKKIVVESSVPEDIDDEVEKYFPSTGAIGLNYTGGTKAMAVHTYRAIEKLGEKRDVRFSYLDPRNLELCIDPRKGVKEQINFKLSNPDNVDNKAFFEQTKISLEDLLYLHRLKPMKRSSPNPRPKMRLPNVVAAMFEERLKSKKWQKKTGPRLKGLLSDKTKGKFGYRPPDTTNQEQYETHLRLQQIPLPDDVPKLQTALDASGLVMSSKIVLANLPLNPKSAEDFCNFLRGTWLEDYVLGKVLSIKDNCYLHGCGSSLEVGLPFYNRKPFFEIDVVAIRGYQLFAIACTLESRVFECKKKLFEITLRARQLGGDETRIALVCLAGAGAKQSLEEQLSDDRIAVFGRDDLETLEDGLRKWFKGELFK